MDGADRPGADRLRADEPLASPAHSGRGDLADLAEGLSLGLQVIIVCLLVGCTYNLRAIRNLLPEDQQTAVSALPQDAILNQQPGGEGSQDPGAGAEPSAPSPQGDGPLHAGSGRLKPSVDSSLAMYDTYQDLRLHDVVQGLLELHEHAPADLKLSADQQASLRKLEPAISEKLGANDRTRFDRHAELMAVLTAAQRAAIRQWRRKDGKHYPPQLRDLVPRFHQLINGGL